MFRIIPAEEVVVGNIKITRARIVGEDSQIHIFKTASLDGQSLGARDELSPGPDCNVGVTDGNALKVVVVSRLYIEEVEIPVTIEDDLSVSSTLDRDWFIRSATGSQIVSPLKRRGRIDRAVSRVILRMILVSARMNENRVARLDSRPSRRDGRRKTPS